MNALTARGVGPGELRAFYRYQRARRHCRACQACGAQDVAVYRTLVVGGPLRALCAACAASAEAPTGTLADARARLAAARRAAELRG